MGKASSSVAEEMQWEEESAPWVIPGRGTESQWCSQITVTQFYGNISKVKMNMRISFTNASQRWLASTCICQVEGDCTPKNFNLPEFTYVYRFKIPLKCMPISLQWGIDVTNFYNIYMIYIIFCMAEIPDISCWEISWVLKAAYGML